MARRVATSDMTIDNLCVSSEIGLCCSLSPLQFQNRELTCGLTYILITLHIIIFLRAADRAIALGYSVLSFILLLSNTGFL